MRVSFIIPSYNQGRFLGACLDGIAAQGLAPSDFETRVYDGGSTDETTAILRAHPLRPWWVSERDAGQAAAVNRGLREAQGEWVAWINADDFYRPGALPAVLAAATKAPGTDVFYGRADVVDEAGRTTAPYAVEPWDYARLADICYLCQPAVFFRRAVVARDGLLDERLHLALDYEYWLRLGKRGPFQFIDQVLAATRDHPGTKTRTRRVAIQRECLLVSHRHTGRWSRKWTRGLAKQSVRARFGVAEDVPHFPAHVAELLAWRAGQFRLWLRDRRGWTEDEQTQYFLADGY